jgi:uncharacterized protein (TIGR02145 family)
LKHIAAGGLSRFNIPDADFNDLSAKAADFEQKLNTAEEPDTRTKAAVLAKTESRAVAEKTAREFVNEYLAYNKLVSDADRENMQIPVHKGRHTPAPVADNAPPHAISNKVWVIGEQEWSDAIHIPGCNKAEFNGGEWDAPEADCRSYADESDTYYYYSWPYVAANASAMCPSPWRVPTHQDFIDLDKALGGSGSARYDTHSWIEENYFMSWAGTYGGFCNSDGSMVWTSTMTAYWTADVFDSKNMHYFSIMDDFVNPHSYNAKMIGFQVRLSSRRILLNMGK